MNAVLPIGLFLVFAVVLGAQKGRSRGRRFAWPFSMTWRSGVVQNLALAAWVLVLATVVLAGADHERAAGACALAAAAFLLGAGVRALTDPDALRAIDRYRGERELRRFAYGLTGMGVFIGAFGALLLATG